MGPVSSVEMGGRPHHVLTAGRISGVYGVKGWVKVLTYTEPPELLFECARWQVMQHGSWHEVVLLEWRRHGKAYIARLESYDDRDKALGIVGSEIGLYRDQLPATAPGEYYWADLVGLRVYTRSGAALGVVNHLIETGANDVMVVIGERERLIPYVRDKVVLEVDPDHGLMRVDWDPEF